MRLSLTDSFVCVFCLDPSAYYICMLCTKNVFPLPFTWTVTGLILAALLVVKFAGLFSDCHLEPPQPTVHCCLSPP